MKYTDVLARYKRLRKVAFSLLNVVLPKYAPKEALDDAGRRLGVMKDNTLILGTMDEIGVVMDHLYYDCPQDGGTAIEQAIADRHPEPGSDEEAVLAAMGRAYYSLVQVESAEPGVGVWVRDLLHRERIFIADVGFSQTMRPGIVMATRLLPYEDYATTGGAALPVDHETMHELTGLLGRAPAGGRIRDMSPEQRTEWIGRIVRTCLRHGASERIVYQQAGEYVSERQAPHGALAPASVGRKPGRNDPCPCGSGRKYKKCCGPRGRR